MAYRLLKKTYEGVDGTNISEFRCEQYLLLMNLCDSLGETMVSYTDIQTRADAANLFGAETNAASAIRTICPILFKFGFIRKYQKITFPANSFFTPGGKMFVKILSAEQKNKKQLHNQRLEEILSSIKEKSIQLGLLATAQTNPDHKIWLLAYIIERLGYVTKDVYFYILKSIQEEEDIEDALETLEVEPSFAEDDYQREDGEPMDSTSLTYLTSNLANAGLITSVREHQKAKYIPTEQFNTFCEIIRDLDNVESGTYLSYIYECY